MAIEHDYWIMAASQLVPDYYTYNNLFIDMGYIYDETIIS